MSSHSSPDVQPMRDTNPAGTSGASFFSGDSESKRYTVQEVIGKGSYGVVCGAIDNLTGERVAIKKITNVFDNVADATRILREIKLLRLLKHADVVDVKHILLPSDPQSFKDVYVVFERMESDLQIVIESNDDLTHDHHKVFLYQLLRGLNFIHASGVLHRDLKPRNILANSTCKLKICDFGLARPFIPDNAMSPVFWTDYVATRWYRAPELCGCFYGRYSQAVDIWSVGCIFAEVLLGRPLFRGSDAVSQLQLITDLLGKPPPVVIDRISNVKARTFLAALPPKQPRNLADKFPSAHPAALALLKRLLSFDPLDRPTAAQALEDPYFAALPKATEQEPAPGVAAQFGFERSRLNEHEIRALIYQEVLHYHPRALAAYQAGVPSTVSTGYTSSMTSELQLRQQFMAAEQHSEAQYQQQTSQAQQQRQQLQQAQLAMQQQLAAQQQQLAVQQQQQLAAAQQLAQHQAQQQYLVAQHAAQAAVQQALEASARMQQVQLASRQVQQGLPPQQMPDASHYQNSLTDSLLQTIPLGVSTEVLQQLPPEQLAMLLQMHATKLFQQHQVKAQAHVQHAAAAAAAQAEARAMEAAAMYNAAYEHASLRPPSAAEPMGKENMGPLNHGMGGMESVPVPHCYQQSASSYSGHPAPGPTMAPASAQVHAHAYLTAAKEMQAGSQLDGTCDDALTYLGLGYMQKMNAQ